MLANAPVEDIHDLGIDFLDRRLGERREQELSWRGFDQRQTQTIANTPYAHEEGLVYG